jgi:hypothetical protein
MNFLPRTTRAELLRQLRPYGCKLSTSFDVGFELWVTGWGEPFTMTIEDDGNYSQWQVDKAWQVILQTKPDSWERIED